MTTLLAFCAALIGLWLWFKIKGGFASVNAFLLTPWPRCAFCERSFTQVKEGETRRHLRRLHHRMLARTRKKKGREMMGIESFYPLGSFSRENLRETIESEVDEVLSEVYDEQGKTDITALHFVLEEAPIDKFMDALESATKNAQSPPVVVTTGDSGEQFILGAEKLTMIDELAAQNVAMRKALEEISNGKVILATDWCARYIALQQIAVKALAIPPTEAVKEIQTLKTALGYFLNGEAYASTFPDDGEDGKVLRKAATWNRLTGRNLLSEKLSHECGEAMKVHATNTPEFKKAMEKIVAEWAEKDGVA